MNLQNRKRQPIPWCEKNPDRKILFCHEKNDFENFGFFKENFQNSINPIVKDEDGIYGYITSINFQYEK